MPQMIARLVRIDGISRKDIKYDDILQEILLTYSKSESSKPLEDEGIIPRKNQQFTEKQLHSRFDAENRGRIRKSIKNKVILLVNSRKQEYENGYANVIDEDAGTITHIGQGQNDQTLTWNNKSVLKSKNNGYTMLYFDKPEPNKLIFRFPVEYKSHWFAKQKNLAGLMRRVIIFNLRILDDSDMESVIDTSEDVDELRNWLIAYYQKLDSNHNVNYSYEEQFYKLEEYVKLLLKSKRYSDGASFL